MAFATVAPLAKLWRALGLNFVLQSEEVVRQKNAQAISRPKEVPSSTRSWGQGYARPQTPPSPQSTTAVNAPKLNLQANFTPQASKIELPTPRLTPSEWPKPWQDLLKIVSTGIVVWTYPYLGCDLLHKTTPDFEARRNFLRGLLQAKPAFPKGTHTFWPYSLPNSASNLENSYELFWAGVKALGGRIVITFGTEACNFLLRTTSLYHPIHVNGILCFGFDEISKLAKQPQIYHTMLEFLRLRLERYYPKLFFNNL